MISALLSQQLIEQVNKMNEDMEELTNVTKLI